MDKYTESSLPNVLAAQEINNSEQTPILVAENNHKLPHILLQRSGYGRGVAFRILILLCISFLSFGGYFAFDSISALEIPLTEVSLQQISLILSHKIIEFLSKTVFNENALFYMYIYTIRTLNSANLTLGYSIRFIHFQTLFLFLLEAI
jgi:hypothetical protein